MSFKYERLTHSERECQLWVTSRGTLKVENQQFGVWMHATTPNMSQRMVIRVTGLDEESNGDEDGQQNDSEGVDEGIGSRKRKDSAAEDAMVARHGEADSDVSTKLMRALLLRKSH